MYGYRAAPTPSEKAKAIAGVTAVYVAVVCAMLLMPADTPMIVDESEPTVLIDVKDLPEPQPPRETEAANAELEEGAAGKKAEPTPLVAPRPVIKVPSKPPVVAAPIAGLGSAATAGAADQGTGLGAGGSGTGRGGGGAGAGAVGSNARLLGGNSSRLPASLLQQFASDSGFGLLLLTISEAGRATDCRVLQTTGDRKVDAALCGLMIRQSRWDPARDHQGQPTASKIRYTATWKKRPGLTGRYLVGTRTRQH